MAWLTPKTVNPGKPIDPLEALIAIQDLKEKSMVLLRDFHLFLQDPNPILIRQFKDVLQKAKTQNKTLIILGCRLCLPPELEREITVIEFALPGKQQLGLVLDGIIGIAPIIKKSKKSKEIRSWMLLPALPQSKLKTPSPCLSWNPKQ